MEQKLKAFVAEVQHLFGAELISVFLYGSAATGEHVADHSDINVGVVLRHIHADALRKASVRIREWHGLGFATPLFLDSDFLHGGLDVFAIEFLDMRERHRTLFGADVLAGIDVAEHNLRRHCEQELRGKLLKLRQTYLESAPNPKDLGAVLMLAVPSIAVLARTLLRLAGHDSTGGTEAVLGRVQEHLKVSTAGLTAAWKVKRGEWRRTGSELDRLYRDVMEDTEQLVHIADALPQ